ncbi:MAG: hypothetical protein AB7G24_00790 [Novosphingobium sp.]
MPEEKIRPRNVAILAKLESTVGTDASPGASDAFPFEADGYSYNAPYRREQSNEANGSYVSGAPLVIGQPAEVSIRVRLKGVGGSSAYSASVKPPHHTLFETCGMRGLFTAAVASAALTAGTTTSGTLGTGFGTTAEIYRGMPLQLSGGASGGRIAHVSAYSAGKMATLADVFASALDTSASAALPANWTYAGTSPKDASARATDHPSATIYIYEDGTLHKFVGCRGSISELGGNTARPGYATFRLMGIYAGKSDATLPAVSVPQHSAPVLAMGTGGVTPALVVNRKELAISQWGLAVDQTVESPDDPNTAYGFGAAEIGGRTPVFTIDPLATLKATRDSIAEIEAGAAYPAVIRYGSVAQNRWSLTLPQALIAESGVGTRGQFRSEQIALQALNPGVGPSDRDAEAILCFY